MVLFLIHFPCKKILLDRKLADEKRETTRVGRGRFVLDLNVAAVLSQHKHEQFSGVVYCFIPESLVRYRRRRMLLMLQNGVKSIRFVPGPSS